MPINNFPVMQEKTLKEKMDEAVYNMINAHKQQLELLEKLDYASKLIKLNKLKQREVKELINGK